MISKECVACRMLFPCTERNNTRLVDYEIHDTQLVLSACGWYCVEHLGRLSLFSALYVIALGGSSGKPSRTCI